MPLHKYVVTKIPDSDHEHGSHYATECYSYRVTCTCGHLFDRETCGPPSDYPDNHATLRMIHHRLDYLEERLHNWNDSKRGT